MLPEVPRLAESLAAVSATARLESSVDAFVALETEVAVERLPAVATRVQATGSASVMVARISRCRLVFHL